MMKNICGRLLWQMIEWSYKKVKNISRCLIGRKNMKKKVTKRLVALILAVVCVFAMAACGGGSSAAGEYKLDRKSVV